MPVKIRLQRQGRKFQSIYSIVVADSRAPRDGKFIESLGQYNPNTNPATIVLDFNRALEWLQKGAQPTDTCRAILSYKGVLYKKHLMEGVKKGAFDEAEAEKRFQTWMSGKEQKIQAKRDKIKDTKENILKSRLEEEAKIKEARALEIAKKRSAMVEAEREEAEEAPAEAPEEVPAEEATASEQATAVVTPEEEVKAEEPVAEAAPEEEVKAEEPVAEAAPEEEVKAEEPVAEAAPEEEDSETKEK
jgi:small subunit ribosomal protein S16